MAFIRYTSTAVDVLKNEGEIAVASVIYFHVLPLFKDSWIRYAIPEALVERPIVRLFDKVRRDVVLFGAVKLVVGGLKHVNTPIVGVGITFASLVVFPHLLIVHVPPVPLAIMSPVIVVTLLELITLAAPAPATPLLQYIPPHPPVPPAPAYVVIVPELTNV